mmetsp:Transcript_18233/g.33728  ORF Transcript_18233/g.33728 Transcript_18233/m.33728 type:complete len:260 (-) Transcript_18233:190-969(-)
MSVPRRFLVTTPPATTPTTASAATAPITAPEPPEELRPDRVEICRFSHAVPTVSVSSKQARTWSRHSSCSSSSSIPSQSSGHSFWTSSSHSLTTSMASRTSSWHGLPRSSLLSTHSLTQSKSKPVANRRVGFPLKSWISLTSSRRHSSLHSLWARTKQMLPPFAPRPTANAFPFLSFGNSMSQVSSTSSLSLRHFLSSFLQSFCSSSSRAAQLSGHTSSATAWHSSSASRSSSTSARHSSSTLSRLSTQSRIHSRSSLA